jgi:hypothetical protein
MNLINPERTDPHDRRSPMFVLRFWQEDLGDDHYEWRASVRHVASGETHYIRCLQDLEDILTSFDVNIPIKHQDRAGETPSETTVRNEGR